MSTVAGKYFDLVILHYIIKDKHMCTYTTQTNSNFNKHTHTRTHTGRSLANTEWHNELGSKMIIDSYDPFTGVFRGLYESAVGDAKSWYTMVGRTHTTGKTVGWTVVFENEDRKCVDSTCTWSGQFQTDECEKPAIRTTWLLTTHPNDPSENWESTNVGFDFFTETPPSTAEIERAKLRYKHNHPKNA